MDRKVIVTILVVALLIGAAYAGYNLYRTAAEYREGEQVYAEVQQYVNLSPAQPSGNTPSNPVGDNGAELAPEVTEPPVIYPEVDFEGLMTVNEDVVGWIYIEGTQINYPILQGEDNRHYVSTMINGAYNGAGSIFMDYRNQPDFTDPHTVIYGHNMNNGSMFAAIVKYQDPEFFAAHPTGMIMTPEGNFQFEVVAGYVASLADPSWQLEFANEADFDNWLQDTMERSIIGGTVVPTAQDQIITLSTCSYEFSDARFVLVCVVRK